jgi:hypothetical protein
VFPRPPVFEAKLLFAALSGNERPDLDAAAARFVSWFVDCFAD